MASRNEQFVCLVAVVALALPAGMWLRYVGPQRASLQDRARRVAQMQETLASYTQAELLPPTATERDQRDRLRQTHDGIQRILGPAPSVSEVYREIEQAAARSGITVVRIEPNKSLSRAEYEGPLKRRGITVESRTYRVELEGPIEDLPGFLQTIEHDMGFVAIREVRLQFSRSESSSHRATATVVLDSMAVLPRPEKGGGS